MTYVKRRNSAESLVLGTTEGTYRRLRPNTEVRNSENEDGQRLTEEARSSLSPLNGYGVPNLVGTVVAPTLGTVPR